MSVQAVGGWGTKSELVQRSGPTHLRLGSHLGLIRLGRLLGRHCAARAALEL